jgi:NADH:ubiquinone oxidoreductase subunit F (NADH-binding)
LVHWLNGGPAKPTATPPRPYERGVEGRPTLVDNVETFGHLAQIARWGADWFRQLGTHREPGTALVTISGAVSRAGVCEVALGSALGDIIRSAGGDVDRLGGVLVGGCFGGWLSADEARHLTFCDDDLRRFGASVGSGPVVVLPQTACGWCETTRILTYFAGESAGQCGVCVNGLAAIANAAIEVSTGAANVDTVRRIIRWAGQVEGRGACSMPDGAVQLVRSALRVFRRDVEAHLDGRGCARRGLDAPVVALPATRGSGWR